MKYGGMQTRPEATLLTEKAAQYLEKGPADVVDLIGHICNLPAAPRIVAEHMAQAMFTGRPEFVMDAVGRWTLAANPKKAAKAKARTSVQPLSSLTWAVVDVETTGGPPPNHRITEIAAVIVKEGEIKEVYETLVNPQRSIPPFVTRLTNISWDMVKNAPTFSAIVPTLLDKLEGNVFVAHNAQFDWSFLSHEIQRTSGARISGNQLCTVKLAKKLLPHLPRRSLDYVANYYGIEIQGRHRAAGDAIATARCLLRMLEAAADQGCTTWEDLDKLQRKRAARKKKKRSAWPSPVTRDTTA